MTRRVCLIHYHEIGLKGKNRSRFENQLVSNLKSALKDFDLEGIRRVCGYVLVSPLRDEDAQKIGEAIALIPGVAKVSVALKCPLDEEAYKQAAAQVLTEAGPFESFKVHARRSNTNYPIHSIDINRLVGDHLCALFPDKKVLMHHPDLEVRVTVHQGAVYVWAGSLTGVGGLPVGTAGKVVSLLSSGFDSPVASWMVGRRGAIIIGLHFSGRPQTPDDSEYLVQDICKTLGASGIIGRLYVVPFGDCQRELALKVPQHLRILMYRRMMLKVAEKLASFERAKAIVTGESLGQVASQTLENIQVVNEAASLPILRPLIGSDKQEIIERAQQIGTFELSAQANSDCCTLFMPRKPETKARMDEVLAAWDELDVDALIADLIDKLEYVDFGLCPSYKPAHRMAPYHEELRGAWAERD